MGRSSSSSDNGATPVSPMSAMDTGRATAGVSAIIGRPTPVPMQATEDPKAFLRDLAKHLHNEQEKASNGNGGGPKLWGMDRGLLFKALMVIGAAAAWLFTWYGAVNKGLEERPTVQAMEKEVEKEVAERIIVHSQQIDPHPGIKEQMVDVKKDTAATRAAVNRMTEVLSGISLTPPRRQPRRTRGE